MKNIYTFVFALMSFITTQAQTANAVVFAETGEKFTLFLNGEKQNNTPQSNVKIKNLTSEFYQARVDFEDASFVDFSHNNFALQFGVEATYIIKRNKKGEFVLRFHSQTEMSGATAVTESSAVNQDTRKIAAVDDEPAPSTDEESITMTSGVTGTGVNANTTVTQTTTATKAAPTKTNGENVAIGMNVGGLNMGINVNVTDSGMDSMDEEETVTTTTRTTTTSSTTSSVPAAKPVAKPAEPVAQSVGRCASSMSSSSFASAKSNIESKSFEDSKMTVAKQVTKANCLTAAQIVDVMSLFSFEESKLDYAKYAYDFCYNQGDYYEVNEAFTFESSIEDLNKFLESK